jgi:hypothetical protein
LFKFDLHRYSAASAAVQIASDNSGKTTNNRAAFTLEARSLSLTLCADAADVSGGELTSASGLNDDDDGGGAGAVALTAASSSEELFRVELKRTKLESGPSGAPTADGDSDGDGGGGFGGDGGGDFQVCIDDVEGWVLGGGESKEGGVAGGGSDDANAKKSKAIWRRRDVGGGGGGVSATGPAVRVSKRTAEPGSGSEGRQQPVQPLEVRVAPLAIMLHPRVAAAVLPFTSEVPATFFHRTLSAARGLPGAGRWRTVN